MTFNIEVYTDEFTERDMETWTCESCGWTTTIRAGGDVAECPNCIALDCEAEAKFEEEHTCDECKRYLPNEKLTFCSGLDVCSECYNILDKQYYVVIKRELDDYLGENKPSKTVEELSLEQANKLFNESVEDENEFVRMCKHTGGIVRDYIMDSRRDNGENILPFTDYKEEE